MKSYCTERVLVPDGENPIFGNGRIIISVLDKAAGPFLSVVGEGVDIDDEIPAHAICFESDAEIDIFARACKDMLREHGKE